VAALQQARLAGEHEGWTPAACEALLNAAHDLKGLGATYEYPLVSRIAASLCRLIETEVCKAATRNASNLMLAHVDAIRAAARDRVKSGENPVGRALLQALEARVEALGLL
jgi:chemotaxis protein histidine kinase CheA